MPGRGSCTTNKINVKNDGWKRPICHKAHMSNTCHGFDDQISLRSKKKNSLDKLVKISCLNWFCYFAQHILLLALNLFCCFFVYCFNDFALNQYCETSVCHSIMCILIAFLERTFVTYFTYISRIIVNHFWDSSFSLNVLSLTIQFKIKLVFPYLSLKTFLCWSKGHCLNNSEFKF